MNIKKGNIPGTRTDFLIQTQSNISYQDGKRVLELNKQALKDYFFVNEIIIK